MLKGFGGEGSGQPGRRLHLPGVTPFDLVSYVIGFFIS